MSKQNKTLREEIDEENRDNFWLYIAFILVVAIGLVFFLKSNEVPINQQRAQQYKSFGCDTITTEWIPRAGNSVNVPNTPTTTVIAADTAVSCANGTLLFLRDGKTMATVRMTDSKIFIYPK